MKKCALSGVLLHSAGGLLISYLPFVSLPLLGVMPFDFQTILVCGNLSIWTFKLVTSVLHPKYPCDYPGSTWENLYDCADL